MKRHLLTSAGALAVIAFSGTAFAQSAHPTEESESYLFIHPDQGVVALAPQWNRNNPNQQWRRSPDLMIGEGTQGRRYRDPSGGMYPQAAYTGSDATRNARDYGGLERFDRGSGYTHPDIPGWEQRAYDPQRGAGAGRSVTTSPFGDERQFRDAGQYRGGRFHDEARRQARRGDIGGNYGPGREPQYGPGPGTWTGSGYYDNYDVYPPERAGVPGGAPYSNWYPQQRREAMDQQREQDPRARAERRAWSAITQADRDSRTVDANGDGVISDTEAANYAERRFSRLDSDGNGQISKSEYRNADVSMAVAFLKDQETYEQARSRSEKAFQKLDANDDGQISRQDYVNSFEKAFQNVDFDDDGEVTVWEFRSQQMPG